MHATSVECWRVAKRAFATFAVKYSDALVENEWYTYPNMNAGEVFPNGAFDPQQAIDCEGRIAR